MNWNLNNRPLESRKRHVLNIRRGVFIVFGKYREPTFYVQFAHRPNMKKTKQFNWIKWTEI